jgi:hypothetical protein
LGAAACARSLNADLHIISKDGDFASAVASSQPHPSLASEWTEKKGGTLLLHGELRAFFAKHFPNIELATDVAKKAAIEKLKNSGSFAGTHLAVSNLQPFLSLLSAAELDELVDAGLANDQIRWIGKDSDVSSLFAELAAKRWDSYPPEKQQEILDAFGLTLTDADEGAEAS